MVRLALCSVVLCFFVAAAFPQASVRRLGNRINGHITLPSEEKDVPEMITVTLLTMGGNFVQQRTISKGRSFSFSSVRNGIYIIKVESSGYEPTETEVEMRPNEEVFAVVPLGQPASDAEDTPKGSGTVVSAKELSVPKKAREELAKAEKEAQKNNPKKAISHLQRALEIHPELYEAYNNLAVQYMRLEKMGEAREALVKATSINPQDARAYRNLAQLDLVEGKPQDALGQLQQAMVLEPDHGTGLRLAGETYAMLGEYQLALDHFERALQRDPKERSYLGMAQCYLRLGRLQEALAEMKGFLELEPKGQRADGVRQTIQQVEEYLASNPD